MKTLFRQAVAAFLAVVIITCSSQAAEQQSTPQPKYEPNWESLDKRPIPEWFNDAKFGIFIVWGAYSVPSWVDKGYAEWYWKRSLDRGDATHQFHIKNYGNNFKYEQFGPMLKAELWDPDFWADIIAKSGAKYVSFTVNYHDGFAMWPTKYAKTQNTNKWNSMVVGPKRDITAELTEYTEMMK